MAIATAAPPSWTALTVINAALAGLAVGASAWFWRRLKRLGCVRAPTWDCGYAAPTARMQYTAGSFAGILTGWFNWILCGHRHEQRPESLFPSRAASESHTPETVLEKLVLPLARAVLSVSAVVRRLQHGRVQSYVLYLILGLIALAALALARAAG
jgi:hydrogenase-4 component B